MSPAKKWHGKRQGRIARLLDRITRLGEIMTEVGIETPLGVKVPDVLWCSEQFDKDHEVEEYALLAAPEVCVEVLSESNPTSEIEEKRMLYFAHGAKEVWICDMEGTMSFYITPTEQSQHSRLFPAFPSKV